MSGESAESEPQTEQIENYLKYVADELGGGYVEQVGDVFYHVQVEPYRERKDGTLVSMETEA